jgi:signal peptidase II
MTARAYAFLIAAAAVVLDQATKVLLRGSVSLGQTITVIPGCFNIVHAENPGVAFSLLADSTGAWRNVVLLGVSSIAVVFLVYLLLTGAASGNALLRTALALILGGAFGNLVDRALFQTVTDFVEVYAGSYFFPAFNVADSCITVGAALLFLDMWRSRRPRQVNPDHVS